jgi:F-type H+-transporting ATPase subunit c
VEPEKRERRVPRIARALDIIHYVDPSLSGIMPLLQREACRHEDDGFTNWKRIFSMGTIMTKKSLLRITLLLAMAPIAWCQSRAQLSAAGYISSALGMAIASGLCGLAQARAVAAAAEGLARNPGASAAIRFALLLGLILIESLALYTLVVIFVQIK